MRRRLIGGKARSSSTRPPPPSIRRFWHTRTRACQPSARARSRWENTSAPRSPTLTHVAPSGHGPTASTHSAQTSASVLRALRSALLSPRAADPSGRLQAAMAASPNTASASGPSATAKQPWASKPRSRSSPMRPRPSMAWWSDRSIVVSSCTNSTGPEAACAARRVSARCGAVTASSVASGRSSSRYAALAADHPPVCRGNPADGCSAIAAPIATALCVRRLSPRSTPPHCRSAQAPTSSIADAPHAPRRGYADS